MDANCIIIKLNNQTVLVGTYRSPSYSNISPFLASLNELLTKLNKYQNIIYVGDINIAINLDKIDQSSEDYLNVMAYHGLLPAHTLVTRDASQKSIDHVFLKSNLPALTLVPNATITDHKPVISFLLNTSVCKQEPIVHKILDEKSLIEDINTIKAEIIYQSKDPEFCINYLIDEISKLIQKNTRVYQSSRRKRIIKPWLTPGLLRCIQNRDNLHLKQKQDPTNDTLKITYKRYRNYCNELLKSVKKTYDSDQVEKAGKDNKKMWEAVKAISNISNKSNSIPKELLTLAPDPQDSLNLVNKYFTNVGKNLADKITKNKQHNKTADKKIKNTLNSLVLTETDEEEVNTVINGLKNECSVGWDGISNKIIKLCKPFLVPILTYIINLCFTRGIFPTALKKSVVVPIYKDGDRDCVGNYRPISLLPAFSKILEKIINNRLVNYLEKYNIFSKNQHGFRKGKSTTDAVQDLNEFLTQNLDAGQKCLGIFLDLAKAFDTVSVSILINKLQDIGVRGVQLQIFESYLSGRSQQVKIGTYLSDAMPITHGVPQGSILGPTLFLIYINDICLTELTHGKLVAYADDTALVFAADSWREVFEAAQNGLNDITAMLNNNDLSLNTNKTKYICFSIRNTISSQNLKSNLIIHKCALDSNSCNCPHLENTTYLKYLGVIYDNNLSFKRHINSVTNRLRKLMVVFKKLRHCVKPKTLKTIYFALCQTVATYCILIWGGAPKTILKPLEVAQRGILKISKFKNILYPTKTLYQECEVLTIRQLFIVATILTQHGKMHFDEALLKKRKSHNICKIKGCNTFFAHKFFSFLGPYLYSKIHKKISIYTSTKYQCKRNVSAWLLTLSYEDTENLLDVLK